jgi:high affinity sulfate transporter 1
MSESGTPSGPGDRIAVLSRWLPGLAQARTYRRGWLRRDVLAGLALTGILVPAGMAYAEASGLPAITGLYATIVPLLAYALLGPSRLLILGPDSSLVPLVLAALAPFALLGSEARIEHAALLAVMVGVLLAAMGMARLGFIADLISMPVREGYLLGIAVLIFAAQLPALFGVEVSGTDAVERFAGLGRAIVDGETDLAALAVGAGCLGVILGAKRIDERIPGVLLAVIGATLVSAVLQLDERADVSVVGVLPQGLPSLSLPVLDPGVLAALLPAAVSIVLVTAADTVILSRTFAKRHGYRASPDQELTALGGANLATGLFSGYPISSSSSRTAVADAAGQRTQLAGLVGALAIGVLLVWLPGLLADLPRSALAAVVIAAAVGLIVVPAWRRLWRWRRSEFAVAAVTFAGVLLIGVVEGILIAVILSLLAFLRRAWWPHDAVLGRQTGLKGYHDLTFYPEARRIPGLVMYRFDAPLSFFNADTFREHVMDVVEAARPPATWVVVAAEPITDVDTTAAEQLTSLLDQLDDRDVTLAFAGLKDPVRARLRRYDLEERIGRERFFPTLGAAVHAFVDESGIDWVDWEDDDSGSGRPEGA